MKQVASVSASWDTWAARQRITTSQQAFENKTFENKWLRWAQSKVTSYRYTSRTIGIRDDRRLSHWERAAGRLASQSNTAANESFDKWDKWASSKYQVSRVREVRK